MGSPGRVPEGEVLEVRVGLSGVLLVLVTVGDVVAEAVDVEVDVEGSAVVVVDVEVVVPVAVGAEVPVLVDVDVEVAVSVGVAVEVAVPVAVGAVVSVPVSVDEAVSVGWVAQGPPVNVFVSRVTEPLRARALPSTVALVAAEIEVSARMFPTNVVPVPRVAELPTCQKTLQPCAPLISLTLLEVAVVNAEPIWNTNTAFGSPSASRVKGPVRRIELSAL